MTVAGVDSWLPNWDMVDTVGLRLNQAERDALTRRRDFLIRVVEDAPHTSGTAFGIALRARQLGELSALNKVLAL